ncbi:hypothetical protein ABEB36_010590 [Hypothenemus hampei]|uniref:Uncharacterized protein n=1 Tax=Hypothenemus hampei TaxID=57062 RepID=A0ABD1ECJ8_HYPHA
MNLLVYMQRFMSKMYRFRVILENSKILSAAGSYGNRCCAITAGNFEIELRGLQKELIGYVFTNLNFKKSVPDSPKYASEVT